MKAIILWLGAALCILAAGVERGHGGILIAVGFGLVNLGLLVHVCCKK